jgi:hypothetical protein
MVRTLNSPKARRWYLVAIILAIVAPIAGIALLVFTVVSLITPALAGSIADLVPVFYVVGVALIVLGLNGLVWLPVIRSIDRNPQINASNRIVLTFVVLVVASPVATLILGVIIFAIGGGVLSALHA